MPQYLVQFDCASGRTEQLHKGDTVDLDGDVADWLNDQFDKDKPLKPVDVKASTKPDPA